jgi:hypothetical protein
MSDPERARRNRAKARAAREGASPEAETTLPAPAAYTPLWPRCARALRLAVRRLRIPTGRLHVVSDHATYLDPGCCH